MLDPSELSTDYDRAKQEPEAAAEPTEKQRFRISVPTLKTTLTMGEGAKKDELYRLDPNERLHFQGFGVTTTGHVHVEARGERHLSHVKVQTNGQITLHSAGNSLNIGAKNGIAMGTDEKAITWGATGALIVGGPFGPLGLVGASVGSKLQLPHRDGAPEPPEWVDSLSTVQDAITEFEKLLTKWMGDRIKAAEKIKEKQELSDISFEKANKPREYLEKVMEFIDKVEEDYCAPFRKAAKESESPNPTWHELLMAGTRIVGQAYIDMFSPNAVRILGIGGTDVSGRLALNMSTDHIATLKSGHAISLLAGDDMEAYAQRNATLAAGEVVHLVSNDQMIVSAEKNIQMFSLGQTTVSAMKELNLISLDKSHFTTGEHHFSASGYADFDGEKGAALRSASGNVMLTSHKKSAIVKGAKAVVLTSGDGLVKVKPGEVALTVDGDAAEASDVDPREHYKPAIDAIKSKMSAAKEKQDRDEIEKLLADMRKLRAKRAAAIEKFEGMAAGLTPKYENGIKITPSKVVVSVGGDEICLKSGKVEVLKSLTVS